MRRASAARCRRTAAATSRGRWRARPSLPPACAALSTSRSSIQTRLARLPPAGTSVNGPSRVVELDRGAAERAAELEVADQRRLGEAVLAGAEAGGGADQRLLAVGADDERRVERACRRPSVSVQPSPVRSSALSVVSRVARFGRAARGGLEGLGQLDVGEVPAEGRQAGLGGVEQRLGRPDQPVGRVDDADLRQRVADRRRVGDRARRRAGSRRSGSISAEVRRSGGPLGARWRVVEPGLARPRRPRRARRARRRRRWRRRAVTGRRPAACRGRSGMTSAAGVGADEHARARKIQRFSGQKAISEIAGPGQMPDMPQPTPNSAAPTTSGVSILLNSGSWKLRVEQRRLPALGDAARR